MKVGGIDKNNIHEIVPVGSSTRIPKVQAMSQENYNGKEPYIDYLMNSMGPVGKCMKVSGIDKNNFHQIVLVGCSMRIPKSAGHDPGVLRCDG